MDKAQRVPTKCELQRRSEGPESSLENSYGASVYGVSSPLKVEARLKVKCSPHGSLRLDEKRHKSKSTPCIIK